MLGRLLHVAVKRSNLRLLNSWFLGVFLAALGLIFLSFLLKLLHQADLEDKGEQAFISGDSSLLIFGTLLNFAITSGLILAVSQYRTLLELVMKLIKAEEEEEEEAQAAAEAQAESSDSEEGDQAAPSEETTRGQGPLKGPEHRKADNRKKQGSASADLLQTLTDFKRS